MVGTISKARLAGFSLILGPVITVICYFIQQFIASSPSGSWGDAAAAGETLRAAGPAVTITSVIIPLALTMLLYGVFFILSEFRGNGEALVGYAKIPMLIGLAGWTYTVGITITFANWGGADAGSFITVWGVNQVSSIMFSLGFTAAFWAIASRYEYNRVLAYGATALALLATSLSIVQLVTSDGAVAALMQSIIGITYIIHTIYSIYLGRGLLARA